MIGTKLKTEAADSKFTYNGRRALYVDRSRYENGGGLHTSDHASMSSEKPDENSGHRKTKVSWARFVLSGLVGT